MATTTSRSTKGASKSRRDHINIEIQRLRELLPLSDAVKDRLFQLQIMSLVCIYLRKNKYLPHSEWSPTAPIADWSASFFASASGGGARDERLPTTNSMDACRTLRGFLLLVTRQGKLLYISENVVDYLGHSVEDIMSQGDSLFDLVDDRDHGRVQLQLLSGPSFVAADATPERVFVCRMSVARAAKRNLVHHRHLLVEGRYLHAAEYYQTVLAVGGPDAVVQPVFAAFCQPLVGADNCDVLAAGHTRVFRSVHFMDMRYLALDALGSVHLGYCSDDLCGMSWYHFVHPADVAHASAKHRLLAMEKENSVSMLVRMQSSRGDWLWLHSVLVVRPNMQQQQPADDDAAVNHIVHATFQLLSLVEAEAVRSSKSLYEARRPQLTADDDDDALMVRVDEGDWTPASSTGDAAPPSFVSELEQARPSPLFGRRHTAPHHYPSCGQAPNASDRLLMKVAGTSAAAAANANNGVSLTTADAPLACAVDRQLPEIEPLALENYLRVVETANESGRKCQFAAEAVVNAVEPRAALGAAPFGYVGAAEMSANRYVKRYNSSCARL